MEADTLADTPAPEAEPAKRRQILEGARRVFLADGFDGASMNDIARVAGVSKGTLYVYFDSKEALFEALIRDDRKQQAERLVLHASGSDPRAALTSFGRELLTLMTQPEMIAQVRIVIAATGKFPSLGRAFYEAGPCHGEIRVAARLETWRAAGLLSFDDARIAARHFLDLCKSGVYGACLYGVTELATPEHIADTVNRAVDLFLRVYGVHGAAVSSASTSLASDAGASVGA